MGCEICGKDVPLKEWKEGQVCPECWDSMVVFDKEFKESGLTDQKQFFDKKADELMKSMSKKLAERLAREIAAARRQNN